MATKRPLKGYTAMRLIRELAISGKPQKVLAKEYGVTPAAISAFGIRNSNEIAQVRVNSADEYSGLWITQKLNRLAELQSMFEDLQELPPTPSTVSVMKSLMRDVAEELGDIPTKAGVNVNLQNVKYEVSSVDLENLT